MNKKIKISAIALVVAIVVLTCAVSVNAVLFYRENYSSTYDTASYSMSTDYYPNTVNSQVTTTVSCSSGHTVSAENQLFVFFLDGTNLDPVDGIVHQTYATDCITAATKSLIYYNLDYISFIQGDHFVYYDNEEAVIRPVVLNNSGW